MIVCMQRSCLRKIKVVLRLILPTLAGSFEPVYLKLNVTLFIYLSKIAMNLLQIGSQHISTCLSRRPRLAALLQIVSLFSTPLQTNEGPSISKLYVVPDQCSQWLEWSALLYVCCIYWSHWFKMLLICYACRPLEIWHAKRLIWEKRHHSLVIPSISEHGLWKTQ